MSEQVIWGYDSNGVPRRVLVDAQGSIILSVFLAGNLPVAVAEPLPAGGNIIGEIVVRGTNAAPGDTQLEFATAGAHKVAKVLLYAADGNPLFAVPPQLDQVDRVAVSIYGKGAQPGDTALGLDSNGVLLQTDGAGNGRAVGFFVGGDNQTNNATRIQSFGRHGLNPSSTWDRLRTIAAAGAGIGVQRVGTFGELITLAASAARTVSANGTAVTGLGWRRRYLVLLDVTVLGNVAGDTLNVYVDVSLDGTIWLNAIHFTQKTGVDAAFREFAVLDSTNPGGVVVDATSDAASGAVRPAMFGAEVRARWAIVDGGGTHSFTFSVVAYAI